MKSADIVQKFQKVSIGMPVYNGAKYIRDAIGSFEKQKFTNFELIISDNASNDETESICRQFAESDTRVRYFRQRENIGAAANFEFVLQQAKADIFMWAAHDDIWAEDFLLEATELLCDEHVNFVFPTFFVQSINLCIGKRIDPDIFRFIESRDRKLRVLQFLALHHDSHKCNIVYSLFRTSFLKSALEVQDIGNDGTLGSVILGLGNGRMLGEALFYKRYRYLWPGALSILGASIKKNYSEEFDLAKEAALNKLRKLFPEYIDEITTIFDHYRPYKHQKDYRICSIK